MSTPDTFMVTSNRLSFLFKNASRQISNYLTDKEVLYQTIMNDKTKYFRFMGKSSADFDIEFSNNR